MSANQTMLLSFRTACLGAVLSLATFAIGKATAQEPKVAGGKSVQHATSQDGTRIAYDKAGKGPALVLVNGALATRSSTAELVQLLSPHFTVYTYDRRGRGDSGDTKSYAVKREIEDLAAIIEAAGGSAHVYGKSSGAALAIQASASLGDKVKKLAIYEAPYSDAEGAAKEWKEFRIKFDRLLAANRRADAVTLFLKFVGTPDEALAKMKSTPAWSGMEAMAPTLAYDNAVLGDDRSVPVGVAVKIKTPTLVMNGGASAGPMPFMRTTADKIAKAIPNAQRHTIEGQAHDVDSKVLVPILVRFFN